MELGRQSPVSSFQPQGGGIGSSGTSLESTVVVPNVAPAINQQATSHSSVSLPIQSVCQNRVPDIVPQLAVRVISGIGTRVANFQTQLQTSSCPHGETSPQDHTTPLSTNGLAGVRNGIEIPFLDLLAM